MSEFGTLGNEKTSESPLQVLEIVEVSQFGQ